MGSLLKCGSRETLSPEALHREVFESLEYIQTTVDAMGKVYEAQYNTGRWEPVNIQPELKEIAARIDILNRNLATAQKNLKEFTPPNKYLWRGVQVVKVVCGVGGGGTFAVQFFDSDNSGDNSESSNTSYISMGLFVAGFAVSSITSYCWERMAKQQEKQRYWQEICGRSQMIGTAEAVLNILRHKQETETRVLTGQSLSEREMTQVIDLLDTIPDEFKKRGLNPETLLTRLMKIQGERNTESQPKQRFQRAVLQVLESRRSPSGSIPMRRTESLREMLDPVLTTDQVEEMKTPLPQQHIAIDIDND